MTSTYAIAVLRPADDDLRLQFASMRVEAGGEIAARRHDPQALGLRPAHRLAESSAGRVKELKGKERERSAFASAIAASASPNRKDAYRQHYGPKHGNEAYWGHKWEAKKESNCIRRENWKREIRAALTDRHTDGKQPG